MKMEFIKMAGGTLVPANEITADKMKRIKQDTFVTAEIRQPRNASFHRKAFALANKAFAYWDAGKTRSKYMNEADQFEYFRGELTILAGYYKEVYDIEGNLQLVPMSWSFGSMDQEKFEAFYTALWNAIAANIVRLDDSDWMMEF